MFDIMCGVHHTLSENNYSLTLVNTSEEHYPGEKVSEVITSGSSDGLIIHGSAINKENCKSYSGCRLSHTLSLGIRVLKAAYAG